MNQVIIISLNNGGEAGRMARSIPSALLSVLYELTYLLGLLNLNFLKTGFSHFMGFSYLFIKWLVIKLMCVLKKRSTD